VNNLFNISDLGCPTAPNTPIDITAKTFAMTNLVKKKNPEALAGASGAYVLVEALQPCTSNSMRSANSASQAVSNV
jgi:pyruvate/2-oxoacid:ferredoxin oxidoreductase beta subunit